MSGNRDLGLEKQSFTRPQYKTKKESAFWVNEKAPSFHEQVNYANMS